MHYALLELHNFLELLGCRTPFSSLKDLLPPGVGLPTIKLLHFSCPLLSLRAYFPLESSCSWSGQLPSTFPPLSFIYYVIYDQSSHYSATILPFPDPPLVPTDCMHGGALLPTESAERCDGEVTPEIITFLKLHVLTGIVSERTLSLHFSLKSIFGCRVLGSESGLLLSLMSIVPAINLSYTIHLLFGIMC